MKERQDRLAELEGTVRELEATVLALTEELVESNERIRHLEAERDYEAAGRQAELGRRSRDHEADGRAAATAEDGSGVDDGTTPAEATGNPDGAGEEVQKAIPAESQDSTDQRDSTEDDIIIA